MLYANNSEDRKQASPILEKSMESPMFHLEYHNYFKIDEIDEIVF